MRVANGITIFASSMFVPVLILAVLNVTATQGVFISPITHAIGTLIIFLVGLASWYTAGRGFLRTGSMRLLLIGTGLFVGAVLFFIHGFISLVGVSSVGGLEDACGEWANRFGALFLSIFLFITIGFSERTLVISRRKISVALFVVLAIILIAGSSWLGHLAADFGICVSASVGQWTPLGRFLQIASIMLLVVSAVRYLHGAFMIRSETALAFSTGIVFLAMSELTNAGVHVSYDAFFWTAHIWLLAGFLSLLWGTVVAQQVPHESPLNGDLER